jgi:hypothetical protein
MDKGLASPSVLALFTVLAILLGVGLPVIKSDAPLKAADWLGFAGNMIAAVFAAVAATVAWFAAQRQIRQATRQNSVIAYGALRDVLAAINADAILNHKIGGALAFIEAEPARMRGSGPPLSVTEVDFHYLGIYQSLREIKAAEEKLEQRRANPWGSAEQRVVRERLVSVAGAYAGLTEGKMQIFQRANKKPVSHDQAVAQFERGEIDEEYLDFAMKAYREFREVIEAEMSRTYALMDRHFESVTHLT